MDRYKDDDKRSAEVIKTQVVCDFSPNYISWSQTVTKTQTTNPDSNVNPSDKEGALNKMTQGELSGSQHLSGIVWRCRDSHSDRIEFVIIIIIIELVKLVGTRSRTNTIAA